jgi:hypothetical protein
VFAMINKVLVWPLCFDVSIAVCQPRQDHLPGFSMTSSSGKGSEIDATMCLYMAQICVAIV